MADQKVSLKVGIEVDQAQLAKSVKELQDKMSGMKFTPLAAKAAGGGRDQISIDKDKRAGEDEIRRLTQQKQLYSNILDFVKQIGRENEKNARQEHIANIQKSNFIPIQRAQGWGVRAPMPVGPTPMAPAAAAGGAGGAGAGRGPAFGAGGVTTVGGLAQFLGVPAAVIGTAVTTIAAGSAVEGIRRFFSEAQYRAREAAATAFQMQGQGGQRLNALLTGGAAEELIFNPQRLEAAQFAQEKVGGRYAVRGAGSPIMDLLSSVLGREGLGALQHMKPIQAARGIAGRFGFKDLQEEFERQREIETGEAQTAQFEALKRGPAGAFRTETANKYLRDWQRNLVFQRQTGLGEGGFRGFLGGINAAGFMDEQGMAMASAIQGAGGSTRSAVGNSAFALQMQRQFDLTNAGKALGEISGQTGTAQLSKDALIHIQAEGTRIGVNQSEFREENRKFVEMAASIINQSTATSTAGVDQLVGTFSRFMGERTVTGMEAGRSAYEAYQAQSNVQTGPSAVMRAAGMIRSPILQKLSGEDQASLFTMNQADVNPDDPGIKFLARKAGVSAQQLVDEYHGIQNSSMFTRKSTDAAINKLSQQRQKMVGPVASGAAYGGALEDYAGAEGAALTAMSIEPATAGLSRKAQRAFAQARASGDNAEMQRILQEQTKSQAEGKGVTGRPGDEMERIQAQANTLANTMFESFKTQIVPATEDVKRFADAVATLRRAMGGTDAQRTTALQNFMNQHPGMAPTNQPSAGPPPNGAGQ